MRVSRQWRNLQARKRAGFGHDVGRSMKPGDLAIFCPACPQPGINLSDDWEKDPEQCEDLFLYLWISIDSVT